MSVLTDALEVLKQQLRAIDTEIELTRTTDLNLFKNLELAHHLYINPAIIPTNVSLPENAILSVNTPYSKMVLQAVYNIADICSEGIWQIIKDYSFVGSKILSKSLTFLDKDTSVPKIIDETTYQVGKALQYLLNNSIDEEGILSQVPSHFKEMTRNELRRMKGLLETRLKIYETHTPEHIAKVKKYHEIKIAKSTAWDNVVSAAHQNHKQFYLSNNSLVDHPILSGNTEKIEEIISQIHEKCFLISSEIETLTKFNEEWYEDLLQLNPPEFATSKLIHSLLENHFSIKKWATLYQNDEITIFNDDIKSSLEITYKSGIKLIDDIRLYPSLYTSQRSLLQARLEEEKKYAVFKTTISEVVSNIKDPALPEDISLSKAETVTKCIEENTELLKSIKAYESLLIAHENELIEKISTLDDKFPQEEITNQYFESYKNAISEAKAELQKRINAGAKKRTHLKTLYDEIHREQTRLNAEVAKQSHEGRKQLIYESSRRIEAEFIESQVANRKLSSANFRYDTYFNEQYKPSRDKINQEFNPKIVPINEKIKKSEAKIIDYKVSTDDETIKKLNENYRKNSDKLFYSERLLTHFKKIINNHTGLYFPIDKISKEKLISALEGNDETNQFIETLYQTAETGTTLRGFNLSNLRNKFNHLTTLTSPSEFDYDIHHILSLIKKRLSFITLCREASHLQELKDQKKAIKDERNKRLEPLNRTNEQLLASLEQIKLNSELVSISHSQAILTDNLYRFDFKLTDTENLNKQLTTAILNMEVGVKTPHIETIIKQLQGWSNAKSHHESSLAELYKTTADSITSEKKRWANFKLVHPQLLGDTKTKIKSLSREFSSLELKGKMLSDTYIALVTDVKINLYLIQHIVPILKQCIDLDKEINLEPPLSYEQKHALLNKLREVIKRIDDNGPTNETIKFISYDRVAEIIQKIDGFNERLKDVQSSLSKEIQTFLNEQIIQDKEEEPPIVKAVDSVPSRDLHREYFGSSEQLGGKLSNYLQERATTFFKRDLFESFVSLITCFNYRSNATERAEYITQLETISLNYKRNPDQFREEFIGQLDVGIAKFRPRKFNDPLSLSTKLLELKRAVLAEQLLLNSNVYEPYSVICD